MHSNASKQGLGTAGYCMILLLATAGQGSLKHQFRAMEQ